MERILWGHWAPRHWEGQSSSQLYILERKAQVTEWLALPACVPACVPVCLLLLAPWPGSEADGPAWPGGINTCDWQPQQTWWAWTGQALKEGKPGRKFHAYPPHFLGNDGDDYWGLLHFHIVSVLSLKVRKIHFFHGHLLSLLNTSCLHFQTHTGRGQEGRGKTTWVGVAKKLSLILNLLCEVPLGQVGHTIPVGDMRLRLEVKIRT